MKNLFTITEAKAKLSEIINQIIYKKEKITITKKGKEVAIILPLDDYKSLQKVDIEGLILAKGALSDVENEVDDMTKLIYKERESNRTREVSL